MTSPGKASAPVKTTLKSSGGSGTVELTVEALADIPRGVGRIVLPDQLRTAKGEIKVVKGKLDVDFGAVPHGEKRELQVTLEVPAGAKFQVFAGVDCHMTEGISSCTRQPSLSLWASESSLRYGRITTTCPGCVNS